MVGLCFLCIVVRPITAGIDKVDAVHRAGGRTEAAARAARFNHGMKVLRSPGNGVGRAGLRAPGASDALVGADRCAGKGDFGAVFGVERELGEPGGGGKPPDAARPAGGAAVDGREPLGNGYQKFSTTS